MLEANFLTILLKPTYEKAVNSPEDALDMGFALLRGPGQEANVELLKNSPSSITRKMAATTVVSKVSRILFGKSWGDVI